jgi:hypothetical protein
VFLVAYVGLTGSKLRVWLPPSVTLASCSELRTVAYGWLQQTLQQLSLCWSCCAHLFFLCPPCRPAASSACCCALAVCSLQPAVQLGPAVGVVAGAHGPVQAWQLQDILNSGRLNELPKRVLAAWPQAYDGVSRFQGFGVRGFSCSAHQDGGGQPPTQGSPGRGRP